MSYAAYNAGNDFSELKLMEMFMAATGPAASRASSWSDRYRPAPCLDRSQLEEGPRITVNTNATEQTLVMA